MRTLEVSLVEWPAGPDAGGPRVLGRLDDADLVKAVMERLTLQRQREIALIEGRPLRIVPRPDEPPEEPDP